MKATPNTPPKVDRALQLGNRLLAQCRAHMRKHRADENVDADPPFALTYVIAEFIAASSNDVADIDAGLAILIDIARERAVEALPDVIARRKRRAH